MTRPDLDYAGLFDASPNPYLVLDRRLHIVGANRAYLTATGRKLEELLGRWAWDAFLTDPETLRLAIESFERVKTTGAPDTLALLRFDIPRPTIEGGGFEERYWSIVAAPVLDQAGEVALLLQHPIDVTELQLLRAASTASASPRGADMPLAPEHSGIFERAQALQDANWALRDERERLRTLFEQAPGFMAILRGPEHVFELANAAYREIAGVHRELLGVPLRQALPELADQPFPALLDEVWTTRKPVVRHGQQVWIERRSGEPLQELRVDFVYQPIMDANGEISGIFAQGHDVTEHHRALAALRESSERERLILQSPSMGIYDWDIGAGLVSFSRTAQAIYGFEKPIVTIDRALAQIHPEDIDRVRALIQAAQEPTNGGALNLHHRFVHPERGVCWVDVAGQVQFGQASDGSRRPLRMLGVARDVTERERLVESLKLADARKNEFLATLAHELRNPLAPLCNVVHLLRRSSLANSEAQLVEMLARQVGQLRRLVDDLLEISRITQGRIQLQLEVGMVAGPVYAALEAVGPLAARRGQRVDVRLHSIAAVKIDPARITQVMTNLLNNAVKFSPEGSPIVLEAFDEPEAIVMRVTDCGIGIAPEVLPRVFELFVQGAATTPDQAQAGLGIGLSLVERLIALHGGSVQAESSGVGRGAVFTLRLPRANSAPAAA